MAAMISRLLPDFEKNGGLLTTVDKAVVKAVLDFANAVGGPGLVRTIADSCASNPKRASPQAFAKMIDHTFLKPHGTPEDIEKLCREARQYNFAMVAVNPAEVRRCVQLLEAADVRVGAAIGFPLGQSTSRVKVCEGDAIQSGATEIDMVLNVRELQNHNYSLIRREIQDVVEVCKDKTVKKSRVICKVILERCYLTDEQKIKACEICRDVGADSPPVGSGPAQAQAMIAAGATRIGTSNGVEIMEELLKVAPPSEKVGSDSHRPKELVKSSL
eukprot:g39312.t1